MSRCARQASIERLLREFRYEIVRIHARHRALRPIAEFGIHDDLLLANHLFVPGDRTGAVLEALSREGLPVAR